MKFSASLLRKGVMMTMLLSAPFCSIIEKRGGDDTIAFCSIIEKRGD